MRLIVDKDEDVLYFRLDENAIMESEEVRPGVILDFDKDGRVVGVEFLGIKGRMSDKQLELPLICREEGSREAPPYPDYANRDD